MTHGPSLPVVFLAVDRRQGDRRAAELEAQARVARAKGLFEVQVADVARVVVARHEHHVRALDPLQLPLGDREILVLVSLVRRVAGDDNEVGSGRVHLRDRGAKELLAVAGAPAVCPPH